MNLLEATTLGILQGLTEFLPISSSGHLILAEKLLHLNVEALKSFDVAIHLGTLLAIFIYFRKDYVHLLQGCTHIILRRKEHSEKKELVENRKLIGYLMLATVPAVLVGAFFNDFLDTNFRNPQTVSIMLIIVGVIFFVAEFIATRVKSSGFTLKNTVLIGIAQACALVPGVSRSGATICAGLVQGIKREDAARFSFLLGSIAITAAIVLSIYKVYKGEFTLPATDILLTGIAASFISGYAAIAFLMKFLRKHTLHIFGVYRVIMGFAMLFLLR